MKIEEVRELIAFAGRIEGRPFPEHADLAWLSIVAHVPIEEARVAVVAHFNESTDHLMPAHITRWRESWEPSVLELYSPSEGGTGSPFEDLFGQASTEKSRPEAARIRKEKYKTEVERLGIDPNETLKSP